MSTMDDYLRKLGDGWDEENEQLTTADMKMALEQFASLLEIIRDLMSLTGMSPEQIFGDVQIVGGIVHGIVDGSGYTFGLVYGVLICALLVEIERNNDGG